MLRVKKTFVSFFKPAHEEWKFYGNKIVQALQETIFCDMGIWLPISSKSLHIWDSVITLSMKAYKYPLFISLRKSKSLTLCICSMKIDLHHHCHCQLKATNPNGKHSTRSHCDDYRPLAIKIPLTLRHHVLL